MLTKLYLKLTAFVLSVDILAKFQRPIFIVKPYNFTTRRNRIKVRAAL